jgi:hypothetical protein
MANKTVEQVEREFIERHPVAMKPGTVVGEPDAASYRMSGWDS